MLIAEVVGVGETVRGVVVVRDVVVLIRVVVEVVRDEE